ncbi:MAG: murein transglycosylase A [Alphaproteobacteria bacterium]
MNPTLVPTTFDALPGWRHDAIAAALPAFLASCEKIAALPPHAPVAPAAYGALAGTAGDWHDACAAARRVPPNDEASARGFVAEWFAPYQLRATETETGLFTGYYEAELAASRVATPHFNVKIFAPPPGAGLVQTAGAVPLPTRADIETTDAAKNWPVLLWTNSSVDLFMAQVQGSARVRLTDGTVTRINYAANNGYDFVAIGRLMLERNIIPQSQASAQGIRAWLKANPDPAAKLMRENPRYIFFRENTGPGPIGAHGTVLTPGRSLAVDPAFVPLGALVWLDTVHPGTIDAPLRRLMVAQDTGNAIKGVVRGDVYFGSGEPALADAGRMKQAGRYFVLLPRKKAALQKAADDASVAALVARPGNPARR